MVKKKSRVKVKKVKPLDAPVERYQDQRWYEKARRWLLAYPKVPFRALALWIGNMTSTDKDPHIDLRTAYSISRGMADYEMKYYYTYDEVKEKWRKQYGRDFLDGLDDN